MAHNGLWELTIVPSVSFKTTSLSSRATSCTRTLSITSERRSKQNLCLSFENGKENEDACRASSTESSKLKLSSPKSSYDVLRRSDRSEKKSISVSCKTGKELNSHMNEKISTGNACPDMCGDTNDLMDAPFIELGAVYKLLDFITNSDPNVSSLTNSCCKEISRILRCLLSQCHDKTLDDLLVKDSSLQRCERCGVISYIMQSHPAAEAIKESKMQIRRDAEIMRVEHDCLNDNQSNRKSKLSISPPDIKNNAQLKVLDDKINLRVGYKYELSGTESLPIKQHAFVMKKHSESLNRTTDILDAQSDVRAKIKNQSHLDNKVVKRERPPDVKALKRQMRYKCNGATQNNESSFPTKADIDKEEIVRKISYERKSQIDDFLARMWYSKSAQKMHHSEQSFTQRGDIYALTDTVKYLARGPFATSGKEEDEFLSKLQDGRCGHLMNPRKGHSSVLYGSRNDYPQRSSGFWLFDESGCLPEVLDEHRYLPMSRADNRESVGLAGNIIQRSDAIEKTRKTDSCSDCLEKDSLEDWARGLQRKRESDTATFSSSSAENLIHEWMGSVDTKNQINDDVDDDVPQGRRLGSSRAYLDIARRVKAEIAKDTCSDKTEKSTLQARDSNVVARLSPETRRKIFHLIQKVILPDSAQDSTLHREKCVTSNVSNGEKLLHSKSMDARFIRSDNKIRNNCASNNIPAKFDLSENANNLFRSSINSIDACSQDLNKSQNHGNISISSDKSRKIDPADHSTEKITRRIIYKDKSSGNVLSKNNEHGMTDILPIYREILENSGNMKWDSFQELVEDLHPDQKEVWRSICRIITEEAKRERVGDGHDIEVCIEISSVNPEETMRMNELTTRTREIVFEVDMTLNEGVESFLKQGVTSD